MVRICCFKRSHLLRACRLVYRRLGVTPGFHRISTSERELNPPSRLQFHCQYGQPGWNRTSIPRFWRPGEYLYLTDWWAPSFRLSSVCSAFRLSPSLCHSRHLRLIAALGRPTETRALFALQRIISGLSPERFMAQSSFALIFYSV